MKKQETEIVENGWGLYIALTIILLMWFAFSGCSDPKQIIYESKGLIVTEIKLGDKPERGKYIYQTKGFSGTVAVWSNSKFEIGDTIKFQIISKDTIN